VSSAARLLAAGPFISGPLVAAGADRGSRATLNRLNALPKLLSGLGLVENISPALFVALAENRRCRIVAQPAVNAGGVYIELTAHILWDSGCNGSHAYEIANSWDKVIRAKTKSKDKVRQSRLAAPGSATCGRPRRPGWFSRLHKDIKARMWGFDESGF
jgi:hypothetical protein